MLLPPSFSTSFSSSCMCSFSVVVVLLFYFGGSQFPTCPTISVIVMLVLLLMMMMLPLLLLLVMVMVAVLLFWTNNFPFRSARFAHSICQHFRRFVNGIQVAFFTTFFFLHSIPFYFPFFSLSFILILFCVRACVCLSAHFPQCVFVCLSYFAF